MILRSRKKFDKYIVGRRRESCGYREVYDAKYNDNKVILTVYDVEQTPPTLFTDQMLSTNHKPMPREAWLLDQLKGKQFLRLIEAGRKQMGDRELAWFTQEYFYPSTLAEMVGASIASEWRIVQVMEMVIKGLQELARVSEG